MEAAPFDWNDYLSSEGLSDIVPTGLNMQGGQAGGVGFPDDACPPSENLAARISNQSNPAERTSTPMQAWHDQQFDKQHFMCQNSLRDADESQEHEIAGHTCLDREDDLPRVSRQHDTIASEDHYQHHGSTTNLEPSKNGSSPVPPQQASSSTVCLTETQRGFSTQKPHELETLAPDQFCTCAFCLDDYTMRVYREWFDGHPDIRSGILGCRVTGCQWTTITTTSVWSLAQHERARDHYGKPGNYRCREADCKSVTKRFSDLKRHYSSKHCIQPKKFPCPVFMCKYHDTGFPRNDKLKSHFQNVHGGILQPGKPNQAIKPKDKHCA